MMWEKGVVSYLGLENYEIEGQTRGGKRILKRENMVKGIRVFSAGSFW